MSCTVYPQGDQYCADGPSLLALESIHIFTFSMSYTIHVLLISVSHLRLSPLIPPTFSISSYCLVCPIFLFTSTQQYSYLNKLPLAFFTTPRRSRFTSLHLPLLVSISALSGDIHTNPCPPALYSCSLFTCHICSILSNDRTSALNDLIEAPHPHVIALSPFAPTISALFSLTIVHLP